MLKFEWKKGFAKYPCISSISHHPEFRIQNRLACEPPLFGVNGFSPESRGVANAQRRGRNLGTLDCGEPSPL
jgi:hypothetical protein